MLKMRMYYISLFQPANSLKIKKIGILRGCEKITWNFGYRFMEQWCNSIAAKDQVFLGLFGSFAYQ